MTMSFIWSGFSGPCTLLSRRINTLIWVKDKSSTSFETRLNKRWTHYLPACKNFTLVEKFDLRILKSIAWRLNIIFVLNFSKIWTTPWWITDYWTNFVWFWLQRYNSDFRLLSNTCHQLKLICCYARCYLMFASFIQLSFLPSFDCYLNNKHIIHVCKSTFSSFSSRLLVGYRNKCNPVQKTEVSCYRSGFNNQ